MLPRAVEIFGVFRGSRSPIATISIIFNHVIAPVPVVGLLADEVSGWTCTVTDLEMLPPNPVHSSVNVASPLNAPVDSLPVTDLVPDQAFDARQPLVSVLFHASIAALFNGTLVALAESSRVGGGLVGV